MVLVSGMHRSGTSAFTRACNLAGGILPNPLVKPAFGNELGHWEPEDVVAMNDRALLAAGSNVNSVFPLSASWLGSPAAVTFTREVQSYVEALGYSPQTWFIKDPRISLLAGPWLKGVEQAGVQPRFVVAFRNPWEVAASLSARQLHHFPNEVWPLERGLALWLNYMLSIERQSRGLPRSFVSYEGFLGDWSANLARVNDQLGLSPPRLDAQTKATISAFLRPEERHARYDSMRTGSGLAMRVYEQLIERIEDPQGGGVHLDMAAQTFAASFDVLGGYLGALEGRAREFIRLKTTVDHVEAEADAHRRHAESVELRLAHLARAVATPAGERESPAREAALDETSPGEHLSTLQKKYDALKAAHRQNLETTKAERLRLIEDLASQRKDFDEQRQNDAIEAVKSRALAAEVRDGREAYEALRIEAAEVRQRCLEAEKALVETRRFIASAESDRAELALIRGSRSWRLTSPLRSMSTLFGRR